MNRSVRAPALSILAVAAFASTASAQVDVSGTWLLTVEAPEAPGEIRAAFSQQGAAVTGTLEVPMVGGAEMTDGAIEDSVFTFLLHVDVEGQLFTVEVEASVDGDVMEGSFYMAEFGSMPFRGRRTEG